ncbi:MAG: rhomboid family intramembrane serine protease [Pirellulaceae bacterium]
MFPIGDDNHDRTTFPIITIGLIVINVLVFFGLQGGGGNANFTNAFSTVPAEILTGNDIVTDDRVVVFQTDYGTEQSFPVPGLRPTPVHVYLTLLTAMFMHGSIAHLGGNMWFLWIFGDNIEHDFGRIRYLLFYLACGLLASLAHVVLNSNDASPSYLTPSLGASGAISGVMGAYLILHANRRVTVFLFRFLMDVPGWVAVGIWFLFQVINGLGMLGGRGDGVAYGAHIGGFLAGMLLSQLFPKLARDTLGTGSQTW